MKQVGFAKQSRPNRAYAAGIIDTNGCIAVYSRRKTNGVAYRLTVTIHGKADMAWLVATFGGSTHKNKGWHGGDANYYSIVCDQALDLLRAVRPYIRVKTKQVSLGIEFGKLRKQRNQHTGNTLAEQERIAGELKREKSNATG